MHYDVSKRTTTFEGVLDVATGVGKTYILAAAVDYLALARGIRNFAVITPGRTILNKTQANFTPGAGKSLLGGMTVKPVVITSDNFASPSMRSAMEDDSQVKLFIFTVQALTAPTSKVARKTHKYQEGLGAAFYDHLRDLPDLVVFADEHHCYYGKKFSDAVRELTPYALLGLTATPHRKTPEEQIIYQYPLGGAIAEKLVKTPVIVGRKDDRSDPETKLRDGVTLLEMKQTSIDLYARETQVPSVNAVMLVIAKDIADAGRVAEILRDDSFFGGRYADKVLEIHSDSPDVALEALDRVEDPESLVRVIVSVGMLKEGWDVKNVYVIVSLRASVSEILTEQTLVRGLRLPFGAYTGIEFLDSLEVLAHERYDQLLKRLNIINQAFVDYRTHAVLRRNARGQLVPTVETVIGSGPEVVVGEEEHGTEPAVTSTDVRAEQAEKETAQLSQPMLSREGFPMIVIPRLEMTGVESRFSLSDITNLAPFKALGEQLAAPDNTLRRMKVSAVLTTGPDGIPETRLKTAAALDEVLTQPSMLARDEARAQLISMLLAAPVVPSRADQRDPATRIVDAFLTGLGAQAEERLSAYFDRVAYRLVELLTLEQRKYASKPKYDEVVELEELRPLRVSRAEVSEDLAGEFRRNVGYEGWMKSMFPQEWFDSRTERNVANILEEAKEIRHWVRLQRGDLRILWHGAGNYYNPDFLAVQTDDERWVIEVKSDADLKSEIVQGKRQAALRWANYVSDSPKVERRWRYLLVAERDIGAARGSWTALRQMGDSG